MKPKTITEIAIELGGGCTALGHAVGAPKRTVWAWKNRGRIPPEWCGKVEKALGGRLTREDLRPDVFMREPA